MDKNLNLRLEAIKLREENRQNPSDINHNRILYNPLPRVIEIKAKIKKMGPNYTSKLLHNKGKYS